jgi:lysophospholipase L1-like esterase
MKFHPRPASILFFFGLALFADAALGQSLSIARNGQTNVWINATAPPDTQYVLQESANLHLWVDINESVSGQSSNQLDSAGVTQSFFRLTPWTPPAPPIIIVLLGDSTVADGSGWGRGVYRYFKSNVQVVNLAQPWQGTTVFLASDEMATMLRIKPDYVFVQYGLIDETTTTIQEFTDNLKSIIQTIRGFNGKPVLITPTANRWWNTDGKVMPWLVDRCDVFKELAVELQLPLIDLNRLTTDLYNGLGESGCDFMLFVRPDDGIHFSQAGAEVVADLVVNALPDYFGTYLTGIFIPPPKP